MNIYRKETLLNDENILQIKNEVVEAYKATARKRATNILKLQLSIEEILLNFRNCYGTETPCKISVNKTFGKILIIFEQKGKQGNPLDTSAYPDTCVEILTALDVIPKYAYRSRSGKNIVTLTPDVKARKNKMLLDILIAVALAVVCFFLMQMFPTGIQATLTNAIITPVFQKLIAIITTVATPLVFFAILKGIVEIGDIRSLGTIGRLFLAEMNHTYMIGGLAFTIPCILVYGVDNGAKIGDTDFIEQLVQLVLDIVPDNLLTPFTVDNDLQVVAVAMLIGAAIICLGEKSASIREAINVISDVVNQMMTIVLKLLPLIVFTGILNILCSRITGLNKLWIFLALFILASAIIEGYMILRVKLSFKGVSITNLFRKQLPTTIINLTTSSQVAAYPDNIICCRDGFGIQSKFVDFGLPLGIVMYMPNGAVFFGVMGWSLADMAGMPIGVVQLVIIFLISTIIAIAAPPIPGSALVVMPMMFSVAGIPNDFFPIAILLGTILGYFLPMLNGYCLQLHMLITGKQLDMVDEEILYTPADK